MSKTIIERSKNPFKIDFRELYRFRELLWILAYRDFRVKYAQTFIGFLWAFINPIFTLLILTFVFGVVAKVDTGTTPHIIYTLAGLVGWTYFASLFAEAGNSIIGAQQMVQKIYFPRLIIPLSKALNGFIDFGITLFCMFGLMLIYQFPPAKSIVFMPFFIIMAILSGLTGGIWMSALTVRYRDFQFITPFLLRLGMYATPIAFPTEAVPEKFRLLFYLNPMAGVVEGMRWSIIGGQAPHPLAYISFGVIGILFFLGVLYFHKVEKVMADIL
ncbi:MAG: lipopolysaccharide transport system permease protein [Granulosicoccus sp.]|jgi:lipopolysaccharide transport system permease protein